MLKRSEEKTMAEEKKKAPASPEKVLQRRAARKMAFATWRQAWRAANPEGSKEQRKEAWTAVRRAETKKFVKALKALEKSGMKVIADKA
jgi:hypothetical protein